MKAGDRLVDDLADAILDGTSIDWAAAEPSAEGVARPLVRQLKVLAAVADLHRGAPSIASTLSEPPVSLRGSAKARTRQSTGVTYGFSSRSAGARLEKSTAPGTRGSIGKWH